MTLQNIHQFESENENNDPSITQHTLFTYQQQKQVNINNFLKYFSLKEHIMIQIASEHFYKIGMQEFLLQWKRNHTKTGNNNVIILIQIVMMKN